MGYHENIEHQLKMLEVTWKAFEEHGVNSETELVLEFSYNAPNKTSALSLDAALENYDSAVRSEGVFKKKWLVEGKSHPTRVTKEILAQWLDYFMAALGWEHDSEFDGFGASMP